MTDDPRTLGFSYGVGWGGAPKPPIYQTAAKLANALRKQSAGLGALSWELDMRLREVRLATLGCEKAAAVAKLKTFLAEHFDLEA